MSDKATTYASNKTWLMLLELEVKVDMAKATSET